MKKQSSVALALVMTTAGVVSALAPVPRAIETPMASASQPIRNASFEIRKDPVPLLMKARPPIEQPTFDADPVSPTLVSALSPKVSDRIGESAAKLPIRVAGAGDPTAAGTRWAP